MQASTGQIADIGAGLLPRAGTRSGTWHLAARDEVSWHGFAEAIFADAVSRGLLARASQVNAVATAGRLTPARRPACPRLGTTRLKTDLGVELRDRQAVCASVLDGFR